MLRSFRLLDRILRGELTRPTQLEAGRLTFPVGGVSVVGIVLAMIYGACMGAYSVFRLIDQATATTIDYRQLLATTLKTPALFFLTLAITFPSLYVFNALVGSRLNFASVLRLLIASLGVNLAVLASLGPIVAFFSLSTNSYGFMVLLNVAVFSVAGILGLVFLMQTLNRLQYAQAVTDERELQSAGPAQVVAGAAVENIVADASIAAPPQRLPGAIDRIKGHAFGPNVRYVFGIWIFVFALVGAQMGWILRPFIGSPSDEFQWFRKRESNFFEAVSTTFWWTVVGPERRARPEPNRQPPDIERPERERGVRQ